MVRYGGKESEIREGKSLCATADSNSPRKRATETERERERERENCNAGSHFVSSYVQSLNS
jgi:hypothetical protein